MNANKINIVYFCDVILQHQIIILSPYIKLISSLKILSIEEMLEEYKNLKAYKDFLVYLNYKNIRDNHGNYFSFIMGDPYASRKMTTFVVVNYYLCSYKSVTVVSACASEVWNKTLKFCLLFSINLTAVCKNCSVLFKAYVKYFIKTFKLLSTVQLLSHIMGQLIQESKLTKFSEKQRKRGKRDCSHADFRL